MAKRKSRPEEMVELTLSTDQLRGASNPAQVAQSILKASAAGTAITLSNFLNQTITYG